MAWILKTVMELGLEPPPPVAVLPLGTGNDLSLSFGWGNTFQQAWIDVRPAERAATASAMRGRVSHLLLSLLFVTCMPWARKAVHAAVPFLGLQTTANLVAMQTCLCAPTLSTGLHMSHIVTLCACPGAQRHITIYETLKRIGDAESRALDVWSVSLTGGLRLARLYCGS